MAIMNRNTYSLGWLIAFRNSSRQLGSNSGKTTMLSADSSACEWLGIHAESDDLFIKFLVDRLHVDVDVEL